MSQIQVEVSQTIPAPPAKVYALLADYMEGHPAILPKKYFKNLTVLEGGKGVGTVIDVQMEVMGTKQAYHMVISEPEPGRVLMEQDVEAGVTTTFTVDPIDDGQQSQLTITAVSRTSPGLRSVFEKLFTPSILKRIFTEELQTIIDYVEGMSAESG